MKIKSVLNKEIRKIYFSLLRKKIKNIFRRPGHAIPVFVFGSQRSGTTMLMKIFHLHPETDVYDEHKNNKIYLEHQIRNFDVVKKTIRNSKAKYVCFKPISDSHKIREFIDQFPDAYYIWIYRDYKDFANSHLRKFKHSSSAIKLVCQGKKGGGWFQEGVSEESSSILRELYKNHTLSDFDFECLVWWARNRLVLEKNISEIKNIIFVKYEDLVIDPKKYFEYLLSRIGMKAYSSLFETVYRTSVSKNKYPALTNEVKSLCEGLTEEINQLQKASY